MTSHNPIVATNEVGYPNGLIPTSEATMPAKIISNQALRKNPTRAVGRLK
jgi:hypothetical protein